MPMANVEVSWQVATDRTFRNIVRSGTAIARPELGHSVHVEADGLAPGREYFYRFRCGGESSQVGRTVTAPAPGAAVDRLRFGVCGCGQYETGYFTGYGRLAEEQFDFVFHTGDYIYEGRGDANRNLNNVRQHLGQEIYTLVDYRNRYAQYKSDPDLMAAHLSAPFIMTWDDHEVDNDYAGDRDEQRHAAGDLPAPSCRRVPGVLRVDAAAGVDAAVGRPHAALPAAAVRQSDRFQRAGYAAVSIQAGAVRRSRHLRRVVRRAPHDSRRATGEVAVRQPDQARGAVDGAWPAGADLRARHGQRQPRVALLRRQVGRLRRLAEAAVRPPARGEGPEPDRPVRRRARALVRRSQDGLQESLVRRRLASSSPTRRLPLAATAPRSSRPGRSSRATTRTSPITATGADTCRARPRPRRCGRIFA